MLTPSPRLPYPRLKKIVALCQKLAPGQGPVYVNTEAGADSSINDCFANVDRIVAARGGGIQYGWQLWETLPGVMAEAEFHAVWVNRSGVYCDVTPKTSPPGDRILFLPDPIRKYTGRQVDNVRIALRTDPLIDRYIAIWEQYYEVMNRGDLATYHGPIYVTNEMANLQQELAELNYDLIAKYYPKILREPSSSGSPIVPIQNQ